MPSPHPPDTHDGQTCALCGWPFVEHELVILYEEAGVPVLLFCSPCAVKLSLPPGTGLTATAFGEED